jgi:hypothetical protein
VAEVTEFAHGYHYGDYSGVILYGPPAAGLWLDRLAVSDRYIDPLLRGILDRAWRESGGERVPRLASDWNTLSGWVAGGGPVPVPPTDAAEFAAALAQLTPTDLAEHCAGCTVEECLRCAGVIREFINSRLARGAGVFIEDD